MKRPTAKQSLILIAGITILVFATLITLDAYYLNWTWTGFGPKTLWDWLDLLIIPIVLATGGLWFSRQEKRYEQDIAATRSHDEALQAYLDKMTELLLKDKLRTTDFDEVRSVARARTVTVLRSLDTGHRIAVLQFLIESHLIEADKPIISFTSGELHRYDFSKANLSDANLSGANLSGAYLSDANLSNANLHRTNLSKAYLSGAHLDGANLHRTNLSKANLSKTFSFTTDLSEANLSEANLSEANLIKTKLNGANLSKANLSRAYLSRINLSEADLSGADLSGANFYEANLSGANLSGANLSRIKLSRSNLSGANLSRANFYEATLKEIILDKHARDGAYFTQEQLNQVQIVTAIPDPRP